MSETKNVNESTSLRNSEEELKPQYKEIREAVLSAIDADEHKPVAKEIKKPLVKVKPIKNIKVKSEEVKQSFFTKKNNNKSINKQMTKIDNKEKKQLIESEVAVKPKEITPVIEETKKEKKSRKSMWKILVLSIISTIIVLFLALGAGIYVFGMKQTTIKKIATLLYLPVGFYDQQPILLSDYWGDIDTLNYFYSNQVAQGVYKEMPADSEIKTIVWDRLLNMEIVNSLAKKYNVSVSKEEINSEIDKLVTEAGTKEKLADNLYEFYQWDIDTFSTKVIGPYLLEQKVSQQISSDPVYDQAAQTEAQEVLSRLRANPEKFSEIAKEVSDDPGSKDQGGDLGYFNLGVMIPEFEQAALALEVGQISELVKTQFGYHIIKLDDKKVSEENSEDTQLKASHILIALPTLTEILDQQKQTQKIIRLLDK